MFCFVLFLSFISYGHFAGELVCRCPHASVVEVGVHPFNPKVLIFGAQKNNIFYKHFFKTILQGTNLSSVSENAGL